MPDDRQTSPIDFAAEARAITDEAEAADRERAEERHHGRPSQQERAGDRPCCRAGCSDQEAA